MNAGAQAGRFVIPELGPSLGKLVARQAEKGAFPFIHVLVAISVALGLFNLLPFPDRKPKHVRGRTAF